jgi:hypothetical protein
MRDERHEIGITKRTIDRLQHSLGSSAVRRVTIITISYANGWDLTAIRCLCYCFNVAY